MSLLPGDDLVAKLIESWRGYADAMRAQDREAFLSMLDKCYSYATAINAKGEPLADEALLMALLFSQQKMINWLVPKIAELSEVIKKQKANKT
jgi:hypothetical protein